MKPSLIKPSIPFFATSMVFTLFFSFCASMSAQPSGGPYGPIQQFYELPQVSGTIFYVAPDAPEDGNGLSPDTPIAIEKAVTLVKTGDALVLRGGIYRTGNLEFNQGITIQPYQDERPVLKGTRVADNWEQIVNGLWRTEWDTFFPDVPADWWRKERHNRTIPLHRFNNDLVFANGRFLQSAGWPGELNDDNFYVDYENGHIYVSFDPTDKLMEISAYEKGLDRVITPVHGKETDGKGFTIKGITITHYAFVGLNIEGVDPEKLADPATFGNDVPNSLIEHCTLSFCGRVGAYIRGNGLIVRHCLVSDTSTEGIFIFSSSDVLFERNIFRRNNIEEILGYFPSALKIFNQTYRVTCRENLIYDNAQSNGIWYDVGNVDGVFVNNWVINSLNGFFFEISKGAICTGNVFVDCWDGIYVLNSSGVHIWNNTLVNSRVSFRRDGRSAQGDHFGWHPSTGPDVEERVGHVFANNLMYSDEEFEAALLELRQPLSMHDRLTEAQLEQMESNVYVRRIPAGLKAALINWSSVYTEYEGYGWHAQMADELIDAPHPEFEEARAVYEDYYGPLFKSTVLGNYQLSPEFPGIDHAIEIPEKIRELLNWNESIPRTPGAWPKALID